MTDDLPKARKKYRERKAPHISGQMLARFMGASQSRKKQIVYDQKYVGTFKTLRYFPARQILREILVAKTNVPTLLRRAASALKRKRGTAFQRQTYVSSAEAIQSFSKGFPSQFPKSLTLQSRSIPVLRKTIAGVSVSLQAQLWVRQRNGRRGASVIVFSKESLSLSEGSTLAFLLQEFLVHYGFADVAPELCSAIDVFKHVKYTAEGDNALLPGEIAGACGEIAALWSKTSFRGDPSDLDSSSKKPRRGTDEDSPRNDMTLPLT